MPTDNKISQDLARAISSLVARAAQMEPDAIIADLDQIKADFLPSVASSQALQLETSRRIAEWKFKLLSERDLPFQKITELYRAVSTLGYTDLETEGTLTIYFAQYCIRQSRVVDAKRILEALCVQLDKALAIDNVIAHRQLKQEAQEILSSI
jgi:hypothetical protein